jgi:hypothetical protein
VPVAMSVVEEVETAVPLEMADDKVLDSIVELWYEVLDSLVEVPVVMGVVEEVGTAVLLEMVDNQVLDSIVELWYEALDSLVEVLTESMPVYQDEEVEVVFGLLEVGVS